MIKLKELENGFEYIEIDNRHARAKIALQGAHIFHYQATGKAPLLWLSKKSKFKKGVPIRGGIPLCWPWFGAHPDDNLFKQHGFARTANWKLISQNEEEEQTIVHFELKEDEVFIEQFPYIFKLILEVYVGQTLKLILKTTNLSLTFMPISEALHTYFKVDDIEDVRIIGLEGREYFDMLTKEYKRQQGVVTFHAQTDRIYSHAPNRIDIQNTLHNIELHTKGSQSTVVWNPWEKKSIEMDDMSEDGYKTMVCVETANVREDRYIVEPNKSHELVLELKY